jgi:hypothetical protein
LGLFVFALVALSGPGRIDIVDGQTRFEVGRSLIEHGDSVVRDQRVGWVVFPGRDGKAYTYYRMPQSALACGAIVLANATGPATEGRQHFFFVLTSAFACSILAIGYACWFRYLGYRPRVAILWALGGIVCTPNWFYGTSAFDDILGTAAIVTAVVVAYRFRYSPSRWGAIVAGLALGISFHCKQPLGAFTLLVLAAHDRRDATRRERLVRAGIIVAGLVAGIATEKGYDWYKYPFDKHVVHQDMLKAYLPVWSDNPLPAFLALTVSPGTGALWYCPPLFIMLAGSLAWKRAGESRIVGGFLIGCGVFVGFICLLTFFKGDPAWGPRYFTPLYALGWLFVPAGAQLLRRPIVALLLALGLLVQVLALSVDPHRQYVKLGLPSGASAVDPTIYFHPAMNQLLQRPQEIWEIGANSERAEKYTPSPSPTFAFPIVDPTYFSEKGLEAVRRYRVLNSLRPWWISQQYLSPAERPVAIGPTIALLGAIAASGLLLMLWGSRINASDGPESLRKSEQSA